MCQSFFAFSFFSYTYETVFFRAIEFSIAFPVSPSDISDESELRTLLFLDLNCLFAFFILILALTRRYLAISALSSLEFEESLELEGERRFFFYRCLKVSYLGLSSDELSESDEEDDSSELDE